MATLPTMQRQLIVRTNPGAAAGADRVGLKIFADGCRRASNPAPSKERDGAGQRVTPRSPFRIHSFLTTDRQSTTFPVDEDSYDRDDSNYAEDNLGDAQSDWLAPPPEGLNGNGQVTYRHAARQ